MKKSIYTLAVTILVAAAIFTSCNTPAQKEEAAKEDVKEAKEDLREVQKDAHAEAVRTANAEEWKTFRDETEVRINRNDAAIAELKIRIKRPGKVLDPLYARQIEDLEKRNRDLRARMDGYEKSHGDWETFKREYNHDMDGLGQSLKDFSVNNKK